LHADEKIKVNFLLNTKSRNGVKKQLSDLLPCTDK